MLRTRIIPTLLLRNESLVKTVQFDKFTYVGDPCNTLRIFNELEVDELIILDITASRNNYPPNLNVLKDIADECFMPLGYGGGIQTIEQAKEILQIGFEKIVINSYALENPSLISQLAEYFGSQAIIVSIDVKKDFWGTSRIWTHAGKRKHKLDPIEWAKQLEQLGAGEILLTSIEREGTWDGFDIALIKAITESVDIPVICNGGAGSLNDIGLAVNEGGASAVGLGSMVVFQKKGMGVLINFPQKELIEKVLD
ncbi:MAG: AglZ/HisF2 family acetamidino modification protein [Gammaproteobacteria bacterium]